MTNLIMAVWCAFIGTFCLLNGRTDLLGWLGAIGCWLMGVANLVMFFIKRIEKKNK